MMDGVNAAGKRVSLLCDAGPDELRPRAKAPRKAPSPYSSARLPGVSTLASACPSSSSSSSSPSSPSRSSSSSSSSCYSRSQLLLLPHHPPPRPESQRVLPPVSLASPPGRPPVARPGPRPLVHPSSGYPSRSCTSTSTSASASAAAPAPASSFSNPHHSYTAPYHSDSDSSLSRRSTSSAASPRYSPAVRPVPLLSRYDSSSSAHSPDTPSPMTPAYPFEPLDPQGKPAISIDPGAYAFASTQAAHNSALLAANSMAGAATNAPYYPSSSAQGVLPTSQTNMFGGFPALQQAPFDDAYAAMPAAAAQVQYQFATNLIDPLAPAAASLASPTSLAAVANPNAPLPPPDSTAAAANGAAPGSATKAKKKYPCPHAAKYNCTDTFTTSGHAARHGKKHTGEKNILCPTCHKAFTRKDNMKQHERTHKNNRHGDDGAKTSGHARRTQSISSVAASVSHKSSASVDMDMDSPTLDGFDSKRSSVRRPSLARPGHYSGSNSSSNDFKLDPLIQARPELSRQFSGESQDGEGESPGLDALAMAATSELR